MRYILKICWCSIVAPIFSFPPLKTATCHDRTTRHIARNRRGRLRWNSQDAERTFIWTSCPNLISIGALEAEISKMKDLRHCTLKMHREGANPQLMNREWLMRMAWNLDGMQGTITQICPPNVSTVGWREPEIYAFEDLARIQHFQPLVQSKLRYNENQSAITRECLERFQ